MAVEWMRSISELDPEEDPVQFRWQFTYGPIGKRIGWRGPGAFDRAMKIAINEAHIEPGEALDAFLEECERMVLGNFWDRKGDSDGVDNA